MWRLLLTLITVAGLCACASDSTAQPRESDQAPPLRVVRGDLEREMVLTGELAAERSAVAVAPVVRIWPLQVRWVADDGALVGSGDRIMEFDNSELVSRLEDLRNRVREARSRLDQEKARVDSEVDSTELALEKARAEVEKARIRADVPEGLISAKELADRRKELERAELELEEARTRLSARRAAGEAAVSDARLSLENAERELRRTEESLDRLVLRAPRDGVLVISDFWRAPRPIRAGDQVWPGMTVARIPDLSTLVVHARVWDVDDGLVETGQEVLASLDAFPGENFPGRVRQIERIAQPVEPTSTRRAFQAVIDLDDPNRDRMRPGMSVKVEVRLPVVSDDLLVPRRALVWEEGEPRVRLANGALAPVRLGPCSDRRCALEDGPPEGTEVVAEVPTR